MISIAESDEERQSVLALFLETFDDIAHNAVPMTASDSLFRPIVVQVHNDQGELVAGALTCRPQMAASISMMPADRRPSGFDKVVDGVSELDLLATKPGHRQKGYGKAIVQYLEAELLNRSVRIWCGNVTQNLDSERLGKFYGDLGFNVLPEGAQLPPFLGLNWFLPVGEAPAFYFWKRLKQD